MFSKSLITLVSGVLFLLPAQAGDVSAEAFLAQVRDELLLAPLQLAAESLQRQEDSIVGYLESGDRQDIASARRSFADLVGYWKTAETLYLAGALNEDLIDHPRLIDHFHQGNESLEETLQRVLQSDGDLQKAMFKSSSKSINALEFLLFADIADSERRWRAALVAIRYIEERLAEIARFYRDYRQFTQLDLAAVEMIINALVDSSYRLANWRIGEAAGLVDKYQGQPSPRRLEYRLSGLSLQAILAILETHARVFEIGAQSGYLTDKGRAQGLDEIRFTVGRLEVALAAARVIDDAAGLDPSSAEFAELFASAQAVHKAYYFLLVEAMNLQGKIVDADGD